MLNQPIAPFPAGIDMMSDITALTKGAARDAVNVNLTSAGVASSRDGFTLVSSFSGGHSLWGSEDGSYGLFVRDKSLRALRVVGTDVATMPLLTDLRSAAPMSFFEAAPHEVFFTNGADLGVVRGTQASYLGVPDPLGAPPVTVGQGGLPPGRYSVAYSLVVGGEESGLSELTSVDLPEGGGLTLAPTDQGAGRINVYATQPNGDVLYLNASYPVGLTSYTLATLAPTRAADNQHLHRMPAGHLVRAYNGRLMVAVGSTLVFSEPFRYGLTSRRHNFVQFTSTIDFIEPVLGGVYVGAGALVYFLDGEGPRNFKQRAVSANTATPGASALIPRSSVSVKMAERGEGRIAAWMGVNGYSYGLSGGEVVEAQSDRIRLPIFARAHPAHYIMDGDKRLLSIVESAEPVGDGTAADL